MRLCDFCTDEIKLKRHFARIEVLERVEINRRMMERG
jgi:hypothetical protein